MLAGLTYPAQRLALDGLPPATVCALRNLLALVLMALWMRWRGTGWGRYGPGEWGRIVFLGLIGYGMPLWLGIVGVRLSSAANGSILVLLEPVAVLVLSRWLLAEVLTPRTVLAVGLGLAGASIMVLAEGEGVDLLGSDVALGNLLLALHGLLWGCYTPVAKPLVERGHDPMALSALSILAALALFLPLAVLEAFADPALLGRLGEHGGGALAPALGWTAFLAATGSFAATVMWLASLRWIRATTVAGCVFLQPLAGVAVGIALLGERLTLPGLLGAATVSAGVLLTVWRRRA